MKKIRNIIIVAILLVATAFNFGIIVNKVGPNVTYACNGGGHGCGSTDTSAECRLFISWACWHYLGEPTLRCTP